MVKLINSPHVISPTLIDHDDITEDLMLDPRCHSNNTELGQCIVLSGIKKIHFCLPFPLFIIFFLFYLLLQSRSARALAVAAPHELNVLSPEDRLPLLISKHLSKQCLFERNTSPTGLAL